MNGKHRLIKLILTMCMLINLLPSAVKVRAEEEAPLPVQETQNENQDSNFDEYDFESQNPIKLPSGGYALRTQDMNVDHDGWSASLKNMDWYFTVEPHFKLDFSSGKTILGIIPVPDLKFDVTFKLGVKGEFSVEVSKANFKNQMNIQSRVDSLTSALYSEKISNSVFDYLPSYYGMGFDMEAFFLVGATAPVKAKGKFSNIAEVKISTEGVRTDYDPVFEYTSVIPMEPDTPTFIYVGSKFNEDINVGEVGYRSATIGPIVKGRIGFMAGGKSVATLHKDEWSCNNSYLDDNITSIHSCTEAGQDGCVDGEVMQNFELYENLVIDLTLPLIDYNVYNKTINVDGTYRQHSRKPFVQSLTYKEKLKYKDICDHMYYKVPVAVWADREMTMPLSGVYVHKEGIGEIDRNVSQFAYGKTGSNPTINANHDGRVNLYLPYVVGKHTIVADENYSDSQYKGMGGKAQMPSDMVRGANETVNIILESNEKIYLTVEKVWDIDLENKDRPSSIEVLLQAQYYNTGFLKWNGIKKAELDSTNDWKYTFYNLPKYEITPEGKINEIKYRIRELAPAKEAQQPEANEGEEDPISWIVGYIDGLLKPDDGPMAADSARVVPSRWDLDNTHVWEQLKKRVTDWNEIWKLEPSTAWLKTLAKDSLFPNPTVDYKVKGYTTIVGEREEDHTTRYWVTYDVEGTHTKITNTAMLDVNMYKRWIMLGDAEEPDSVYLALLCRPNEKYRQFIGAQFEQFIGLWLPIFNPLGGNKINILSLVGLDVLAKFDILNKVSIPITIGNAKAKKGALDNPLTAWRVNFKIKKYGWLGIPGIPIELQAQELSSAIITDALKYLSGMDIPISMSFNPFSGDMYATVPGKAMKLPVIDKDYERTANVINTWYENDDDNTDVTSIGGIKYWLNDDESKRPDTLTIVVKDGETEVGRTTISKNDDDNKGKNSWAWSLLSSDVNEGITLDPDKQYQISEEYPQGYQYKDNYVCRVEGNNLFNTWADGIKVVIHKEYDFDLISTTNYYPDKISYKVSDGSGNLIGTYDLNEPYKTVNYVFYTQNEQDVTLVDGGNPDLSQPYTYKVEGLRNMDISKLSIEEQMTFESHHQQKEFYPEYTGPTISTETDANGNRIAVYTFTVTNKVQRKVRIEIEKDWINDNVSIRPENIDLVLKRNGEAIRNFTMTAYLVEDNGHWKTYILEDNEGNELYYFDPQTHERYEYTLEEVALPEGYESTCSVREIEYGINMSLYKFNLINDYKAAHPKVSVTGKKVWDDGSSSSRPQSITISIISSKDGPIRTCEVSEADNWSWNIEGLERYDEQGKEITYSVSELTPDGYCVSCDEPLYDDESKSWICNITNSINLFNLAVRKQWDDDDDALGIRPQSVTVHLYQVTEGSESEWESAELNEENSWTAVFSGLEKKDAEGNEISWKIEEDPVDGYESKISGSAEEGFAITNVPDGKYFSIPVAKIWKNDENYLFGRPQNVTVYLCRDDEIIQQLQINATDEWKGIFTGVLKIDEDGNEVNYAVKEDRVSGYGEPVITGSAEEGFTVTNTFDNRTTVTVRKVWQNYDGSEVSFTSVPFALYRKLEGESTGTAVFNAVQLIEAESGWIRVYEDLEKYDSNRNEYIYYVLEGTITGYTAEYRETSTASGTELTMVNRQINREITVRKIWDDDDDTSHSRPAYAMIHVLANGQRVMDGNGQEDSHYHNGIVSETSFRLPAYEEDGKTLIIYTIEEDPIEGYISSIEGNMADGFTITNTLVRKSKDITVVKKWADEDNAYNTRPQSVTVRLMADGIEYARKQIKADSNGDWNCTFEDVPVVVSDDQGNQRAITYTISEDTVAGYDTSIDGFTITNTLRRISFEVTKIWDDNGDEHGIRPEEVYVTLLINDRENQNYRCRLTDFNDWTYRFADLPAYINGEEAEYYVAEETVDGYVTKIKGSAEEGFEITNTYRVTTTDITVEKIWEDELDSYPEVTIVLLSDRSREGSMKEVSRVTLNGRDDDWKHVFENMPIYASDNRQVNYFVEEEPLEGFMEPYISEDMYSFTVHNWKQTDKAAVLVEKTWEDENSKVDRPEQIVIELLRNDEPTGDTLILNEENGWSGVFEGLKRLDDDGKEFLYTVREQKTEGFSCEITQTEDSGIDGIWHYVLVNKPELYWVTFVDYDDTVLLAPKQYVYKTRAEDITRPADPKRERDDLFEYTFMGWDPQITDVTGDAVYKAVYDRKPIRYKITYVLNGGTYGGSTGNIEETYDSGTEIVIHEAPTREGYEFLYWEGSQYDPGDKYTVTEDHVFVAKWKAITPDQPDTGDVTDRLLWISLLAVSASGILLVRRRKREEF